MTNLRPAFVPRRAYRSLHIGEARWPDASAAVGGAAGHDGPPRATIERATSPRPGQVLMELDLIDPRQLHGALVAQRANRGVSLAADCRAPGTGMLRAGVPRERISMRLTGAQVALAVNSGD